MQQALAGGAATVYAGVASGTVKRTPMGVIVSRQGDSSPDLHEIIVATGFRPNLLQNNAWHVT